MAILSGEYLDFSSLIIFLSNTDLPVPADPVKNRDSPLSTKSITYFCSRDKMKGTTFFALVAIWAWERGSCSHAMCIGFCVASCMVGFDSGTFRRQLCVLELWFIGFCGDSAVDSCPAAVLKVLALSILGLFFCGDPCSSVDREDISTLTCGEVGRRGEEHFDFGSDCIVLDFWRAFCRP